MIYELDKRGYQYDIYSRIPTDIGYYLVVRRKNDIAKDVTEEKIKEMLNNFRDDNYYK